MLKFLSKLLLFCCLCSMHLFADVNVLIVGTTKDTGAHYGWADSKTYDISKVKTELQKILSGANLGAVNVSFHDFSSNGRLGNNLLAEFFSDNTSYPPTSRPFWEKLRGESGTDWDYVILMGEAFTIEKFPGVFTRGAAELTKEVTKGNAETFLFMTWPGNGSSSTVNHHKEVVYRTGRSIGAKVIPAGLAWEAEGSVHGDAHPSNDSAYLAAASIYSRIWAKSASTSSYSYNDTLADSVHQTVTNNIGKEQYTGLLENESKIFDIMHEHHRNYGMMGLSSSTENGFRKKAREIMNKAGLDGHLGDGTIPKWAGALCVQRSLRTDVDAKMTTAFSHPGNTHGTTNESYYSGLKYEISSHLRSYNNYQINYHEGVRHMPSKLLWANFCKHYPEEPLIVSQHGSRRWNLTQGAFMITMFTGRCPLGPEPHPLDTQAYKDWHAIKIGYETAWAFGRLQGRAPGFRVVPSDEKRHTVDPHAPETMTVQFVLPSTQDVTVNIATDKSWATVSPSTLTFSAGDTETVKEVTVSISADAINRRGEFFKVSYTTTSDDEICDGLSSTWVYAVNSLPVPLSTTAEVIRDGSVGIKLSASDPDKGNEDPRQNISFEVVTQPKNGTVILNGDTATYVPNPGYFGPDSFEFNANDGLVSSSADNPAVCEISVYADLLHATNLLYNNSAELTPLSDWGWTGDWQSIENPESVTPRTGTKVFQFPANLTTAETYQDILLNSYVNHIEAGIQSFELSAFVNDGAKDDIRIYVEFLDATGAVLGTPFESARTNSNDWVEVSQTLLAPVGAKVARITIKGTRLIGTESIGWVEDISFKAVKPQNSAPTATDSSAQVPTELEAPIELDVNDIDQDILTYRIIQAPQNGSIVGTDENGLPIYLSNPGFIGEDSFSYVVNDGEFDSNQATVSLTINANQRPVINLIRPSTKTYFYMTLTNGAIMDMDVTDDGAPADPGQLTYQWSLQPKHTPPSPIVFESPNSPKTAVKWDDFAPGEYLIQLHVSDGAKTSRAKFSITVLEAPYINPNGGNVAPQVDVGGPYLNVVAGQALQLEGVNFFDDGVGVQTYEWKLLSGPGNAVFSDSKSLSSLVTFSAPGEYILRLFGDDEDIRVFEDVTISVAGGAGNTAPVASNSSVTTDEDTAVNVALSASDANNDTLTYSIVSGPANGTLSGSGANRTYTPNAGFFGSDSVTFKVNDGNVDSNTATVSITVNEVAEPNTPPVVDTGTYPPVTLSGSTPTAVTAGANIYLNAALDDGANSIWEDELSTWDLTLDSTTELVTYVANPVTSLPGISAAYNFPGGSGGNGGGSGNTFHGGWDAEPVSIEIWLKPNSTADDGVSNGQILFETGGKNGLGIFYNDGAIEVGHDTTEVISNYDVSALADEFIQVVLTYDKTNFVLYVNGSEATTGIRSDSDWSGSDTAGLGTRGGNNTGGRGNDDANTESFEGQIAIFRAYRNKILNASEVQANYQSVAGGATAVVSLAGIASDADNDTLTIAWSKVSGPGTVSFSDASSLNSTATFTVAGTYTLRLTADDGTDQVSDDVAITVNEAVSNTAPVASNSSVTTDEDTAVSFALSASDADNDPLTYTIVSAPSNGSLSGSGASRTYTPNAGFFGTDSITFKVNDGTVDSNTATVSITINEIIISDTVEIIAEADAYVRGGSYADITYGSETRLVSKKSGNTKYIRHTYLRYDLSSLPSSISSAKLRLYANNVNSGAGLRKLKLVSDDSWQENSVTFNNAPAPAADDIASFQPVENEFVEVDITAAVQSELAGDGKISLYFYSTGSNGNGDDYSAFVSREHSTVDWRPALVIVTESTPDNTPPVAGNSSVTTEEDTSVAVNLSASDADNDPLTYSIISGPANGTLSGSGANRTYTPNVGFSGTDSFTFSVNDGTEDSNTATVSITVEEKPISGTVRYEAEDAVVFGGRTTSGNGGFSGNGYVDYQNSTGDYVEWTVSASQAGDAQLVFGYALGKSDRPLEISVNGVVVAASLSFPNTGGWTSWGETVALTVTLNAGTNTVRATAIGSSGGNVDYLDVTTNTAIPGSISVTGSVPLEDVNTEIVIGGDGPLTEEKKLELASTIDLLVLNEGTFTMIVTSESGTYTFNLEPGEIFDYQTTGDDEYSVTYSSSEEIMDLLDILFADDPILEVKFP